MLLPFFEISNFLALFLFFSANFFRCIFCCCVWNTGTEFWAVQYHPEYDLHDLARLIACRIPKLIKNGNFFNEEAAHQYIADLETLFQNPTTRRDLAWKMGIDEDVMDAQQRLTEVAVNPIDSQC
jgi:GMP synthase (glutamine-hydrolysing)